MITPAAESNKSPEENLGIGYLAKVCRNNGVHIIVIDGWLQEKTEEEIIDEVLGYKSLLFIGFSCNLLNGDASLRIAKKLKPYKKDVPFIAGGFSPTLHPMKFLSENIDYVVLGEGEGPMASICQTLIADRNSSLKKIDGVGYINDEKRFCYNKQNYIKNLDEIAFPDRDTIKYVIKRKVPVNMLSSRGCMGHCSFCSVAAFWRTGCGNKWRGRSVKNIVDEIEDVVNRGAEYIKFVDDSFIDGSRNALWCNEFADEILERNIKIKFRITMRTDKVKDNVIRELVRAGCDSIVVGVENYAETALNRMSKLATSDRNIEAITILRKYPIYTLHGFILFDNKTTLEELKTNYYLLKKYSWPIMKGIFSEMYAAEGTEFTNKLKREGKITKESFFEDYPYKIENNKVREIYIVMKYWHAAHAKIYDALIEPLNKPRVLSEKGAKKFYQLYTEIHEYDLEFMGGLLDDSHDYLDLNDLIKYTEELIARQAERLRELNITVWKLYESEGMQYLAADDPFTYKKWNEQRNEASK